MRGEGWHAGRRCSKCGKVSRVLDYRVSITSYGAEEQCPNCGHAVSYKRK